MLSFLVVESKYEYINSLFNDASGEIACVEIIKHCDSCFLRWTDAYHDQEKQSFYAIKANFDDAYNALLSGIRVSWELDRAMLQQFETRRHYYRCEYQKMWEDCLQKVV